GPVNDDETAALLRGLARLDRFLPDLGGAELDHVLGLLGGDHDLLAGGGVAALALRAGRLGVTAEDTKILEADLVALADLVRDRLQEKVEGARDLLLVEVELLLARLVDHSLHELGRRDALGFLRSHSNSLVRRAIAVDRDLGFPRSKHHHSE